MLVPATTSTSAPETPAVTSELIPPEQESDLQTIGKKRGKKRKGKARGGKPRSTPQKPSKWADRCMYAELLEMPDESETFHGDGVPDDLETGWVALAPVPTGKRCLAVTHATAGIAGVVPNTTIRSRVLGKPLLKPFPSSLPPNTVLDCILDENWRFNGIVHVLDVLTWKGQDIADCETPFRLWWRDTRLSELPSFPPSFEATTTQPSSSSETSQFQFAHPVTFMPIPYHTNISLSRFVNELIPLTRVSRHLPVQIPITNPSSGMDLDIPSTELQTVSVEVKSDGILLYVSQATYEPGTSPLSTWIPIRAYTEWKDKDKMEDTTEGPLDKFERLIRKRLSRSPGHHASEPVEIEMN
ncbi:unnamed protein product [Somion occarium]|uniref:Snurportin-1 n=1 Tax=Somion occarium TaxID=3059160 RepID=A0ABP1DN51_9APHY